MDNAMKIAAVLGPVYLVVGLSYLLYAKQWSKVYTKWAKDHFALLPMVFMMLVLGLIMVKMYNVWEWNIWLIVTITGWGLIVKSVYFLLFPEDAIKSVLKSKTTTGLMHLGGVLGLVLGAALTYYTYMV